MLEQLPQFIHKNTPELEDLEKFWLLTISDSPVLVSEPKIGDDTGVQNDSSLYNGYNELSLQAIHNHPDNSLFSSTDWLQFLKEPSLKRMVVFGTKKGNSKNPIYIAEKTTKTEVKDNFMKYTEDSFNSIEIYLEQKIREIKSYQTVYNLVRNRPNLLQKYVSHIPDGLSFDEYTKKCFLLKEAFDIQIFLVSHISKIRWIDQKYLSIKIAKEYNCNFTVINGEIPDHFPKISDWREFLKNKQQQDLFHTMQAGIYA